MNYPANATAAATGFGATPEDWQHFVALGLTVDLLPVVSNPLAVISPESTVEELGKTPSQYNGRRHVTGILAWTEHVSTAMHVARWLRERDYGICLQMRRVRALDVDVTDPELASQIHAFITERAGVLPTRSRPNAAKFLVAFDMPGEFRKKRVKCASGMVEFLAHGQQAVMVGQHPSGVRYEWIDGLPDAFPPLPGEQFEALWADLVATFGIEAPSESSASVKSQKLADVVANDPVAQFLLNSTTLVKRTERDGRVHITCPFEHEHTSGSGDSSTTYWPAHTGGYMNGHFKCLHSHCEHRSDQEFLDAVGYQEDLSALAASEAANDAAQPAKRSQLEVRRASQFANEEPIDWFIYNVLPRADVAVIYGPSGSGKTFFTIDLAMAVGLGANWRGRDTQRGRVVYICAEGGAGVRMRLRAYAEHHVIPAFDLDDALGIVDASPNLRQVPTVKELAQQIALAGGADLVVVDTLSQVLYGDENSDLQDLVSKVREHLCRPLKALALFIHHTGKDESRGARGSSALPAAADTIFAVREAKGVHEVTVEKQKDGPKGAKFGFSLQEVDLGMDRRGNPMSSLVVLHTGARLPASGTKPQGKNQNLVYDTAVELLERADAVRLAALVEAAAAKMPEDMESGRDRRAEYVQKAVDKLVKRNLLVLTGSGQLALPHAPNLLDSEK